MQSHLTGDAIRGGLVFEGTRALFAVGSQPTSVRTDFARSRIRAKSARSRSRPSSSLILRARRRPPPYRTIRGIGYRDRRSSSSSHGWKKSTSCPSAARVRVSALRRIGRGRWRKASQNRGILRRGVVEIGMRTRSSSMRGVRGRCRLSYRPGSRIGFSELS